MQQLYAKFRLDCNDLIKNYCIDYLDSNWNFKDTKIFRLSRYVDEFKLVHEELADRKLPPLLSMSIFCRGPYNVQRIHIDTVPINDTFEKSKANFYIPIFNDSGKLVWFDPNQGKEIVTFVSETTNSTNQKTPALYVAYSGTPPVIAEYAESDSVIINTLVPHRAESGSSPRAALSFRVGGNLDLFKTLNLC